MILSNASLSLACGKPWVPSPKLKTITDLQIPKGHSSNVLHVRSSKPSNLGQFIMVISRPDAG